MICWFVTFGHKLVLGPLRDPLLPAVHSFLPTISCIRLSMFSNTCALFHFLDHSYPASFPQVAHSSAKNRGYTPTRPYHGAPLSAVNSQLSAVIVPLSPFTTSLAQKQGGAGCWSYHSPYRLHLLLPCSPFPASSPAAASAEAGHLFCYPMERAAFLRHRPRRPANSHRKAFLP
jgi:hypothetical protein